MSTPINDLSINQTDDTPHAIDVIIPHNLSGQRLDAALAAIIPELSRSCLTNWIKQGQVLLNGKPPKPKDKVFGGESVTILPSDDKEESVHIPESIPFEVVYIDEHIIVINKPANLIVHPGNGNWYGTLLNGLLYRFPELKHVPRAGIVHRLDKDTSGLMVVARTIIAQFNLVKQLQNRTVSRIYHAIVEGHTAKSGSINKNIGRDPRNRIKMTTLDFGGKEAITHYKLIQQYQNISHIECRLETGRTHQIRVHLKSIKHPIVGDPVYNSNRRQHSQLVKNAIASLNRQALHATSLSFRHPDTNEEVSFKVPLAADMQRLLDILNNEESGLVFEESDNE